jgi:hypothetical protein
MFWESIKNPSQEMLDKLFAEKMSEADRPCPDCAVKPGKKHKENCDVARCLNCGGQRLSCDCKEDEGYGDKWDGLWPGTKECYEKKYMAKWVGRGPFKSGRLVFDYNRLAIEKAR